MPQGETVIAVAGVTKRYSIYDRPADRLWQGLWRGRRQFFREFWALHEISFSVARGETVAIIGHNGSGKSTLLQIICGTLSPSSGQVLSHGRVAALLELGAGFNPDFTGRENVFLNGTILGLSRQQVAERFEQIAAFAEIGDFIDQPVKTYSSGMIVRLAFAVIAHVDADVLVIDEALAVGDALFTQKCVRFLRRFQENGTILFVSHDTGAVLNLCQRALWLAEGRLIQSGPAKEVVEAYIRSNIEIAQRQALERSVAEEGQPKPALIVAPPVADASQPTLGIDGSPAASTPFGAGGARIDSAQLLRADGSPTAAIRGGDPVILRMRVTALSSIDSVIVGFNLKDRLGQVMFGENTRVVTAGSPVGLQPSERVTADFGFVMPHLRTGKYTLDLAVADGTQHDHVQHQWYFDAVLLDVISDVPFMAGMFAVPMTVELMRDRP